MTSAKVDARALPSYYWRSFFALGTQYYAAARLLFFANGAMVTGTLAHHAVEMSLKGALCSRVPITELRQKFKHSLPLLWDHFKMEKGDVALARFDSTIALLAAFDDLRYPDKVVGFAVQLSIEPTEILPTPHVSRNFQLVLRDLDALVQCILAKASVDPLTLGAWLNKEGRAALARDNATGIWTERKA